MMYSGAIPSPPDPRDYTVGAAMTPDESIGLPDSYQVWQPATANQKTTGNCVAQAMANLYECIFHRLSGLYVNFSVGFRYGDTATREIGRGMVVREALARLVVRGNVDTEIFESNADRPTICDEVAAVRDQLMPICKRLALEYISFPQYATKGRYVREFMLAYGLPVLVVIKMDPGYHAMVCYGWRGDAWLVHNSWGPGRSEWQEYGDIFDFTEVWGLVPKGMEKYKDVPERAWYYQAVMQAAEAGIMRGYADGTFQPDASITRAESAQVMANALRVVDKMIDTAIDDFRVAIGR